MRRIDDQAVQDFVARRFGELRRTAYLMCGDWDRAENAAETALAKVVAAGAHGRTDHLDEQARRALMDAFHHDRRRARRERIYTAAPEHHPRPGAVDDPAVTIPVLAALRQLPPKRQAVVVLSCWQKLGAQETADALGISVRATRGHARRGIATLRERLRELVPGPDRSPVGPGEARSGHVAGASESDESGEVASGEVEVESGEVESGPADPGAAGSGPADFGPSRQAGAGSDGDGDGDGDGDPDRDPDRHSGDWPGLAAPVHDDPISAGGDR